MDLAKGQRLKMYGYKVRTSTARSVYFLLDRLMPRSRVPLLSLYMMKPSTQECTGSFYVK
jgi:hypothetical protein